MFEEKFIKVGWINRPGGSATLNVKYIIAAIVIIVLIPSVAFVYTYYQGQASDSRFAAFENLMDDHEYKTVLTSYPEKIVSIAPSCTEILFAIGAGDKVVGVSDYCDYPYDFAAWVAADNMTSIGEFTTPNLEVIISLNPDLIFASGGVQDESVDTLRELGFKVLVLDPTSVDGVLKNIELAGNATGNRAEAATLREDITKRIDSVQETVAKAVKPRVYYELYYDTTSSWTIGSEAWQNEIIEKAGGINLFKDQQIDYYQYQAEALIARNPDVIVLPGSGMGTGQLSSLEELKARPGWDTTNAVQNDRLYRIDSNIIERSGPRVADAIEQLARFFHPGLF